MPRSRGGEGSSVKRHAAISLGRDRKYCFAEFVDPGQGSRTHVASASPASFATLFYSELCARIGGKGGGLESEVAL